MANGHAPDGDREKTMTDTNNPRIVSEAARAAEAARGWWAWAASCTGW